MEFLPASLLTVTLMLIKITVIVIGCKELTSCHYRFCFQRFNIFVCLFWCL